MKPITTAADISKSEPTTMAMVLFPLCFLTTETDCVCSKDWDKSLLILFASETSFLALALVTRDVDLIVLDSKTSAVWITGEIYSGTEFFFAFFKVIGPLFACIDKSAFAWSLFDAVAGVFFPLNIPWFTALSWYEL